MQTGDSPLSANGGVPASLPCHPRGGGDLLTDRPKAAIEIAKGLLKDGVPMEIIVRNTGLSEEQIRKL